MKKNNQTAGRLFQGALLIAFLGGGTAASWPVYSSPLSSGAQDQSSSELSAPAAQRPAGLPGIRQSGWAKNFPSMQQARFFHTATTLEDGKSVLVVGAPVDPLPAPVAELYTKEKGWTSVEGDQAAISRMWHTATQLKDGTGAVVFIGGKDKSANGVAWYTPGPEAGTGKWRFAEMEPRLQHTATLLETGKNKGKILVTGGIMSDPSGKGTNSVQLFDPKAKPGVNPWTDLPPMLEARLDHTATLVTDDTGREAVLLAGGFDKNGADNPHPLESAELYYPDTGERVSLPKMKDARVAHTATKLNDGKVLVAGGETQGDGVAKSAELFDPATKQWLSVPDMEVERAIHTATLLADGNVLVAGGDSLKSVRLKSAELYDPINNRWIHNIGDMNEARDAAAATRLADGSVMITGGLGANTELTQSVELYTP